jgi:ATP-dependent DNA helicase RecQ
MTYIETLDLYKEGYLLNDIAQKRDLSTVTIISHLVKLKEDGHDIDLKGLIDKKAYQTIIQAAQEIQTSKNDPLKPLFELLNEQFDYGQIRLALAIWEEER